MKKYSKFNQISIFLKEGDWFIDKNGKTYNLNPECLSDPFLVWLPLLEIEYFEFEKQLSSLNKEYFKSFPTLLLLKQGLKSNSSYWINLSIRWLEDVKIDSNINEILIDLLKFSKKIDQSAKHKIQKLIQ